MRSLQSSVTVTEKALGELRRVGADADTFLRIKVVPGGCSGMTYSASLDDVMGEGDETVASLDGGIRVIADEGSVLLIDGLQIDFSDDLVQAGFRFKNPNASNSCGCGSSFGA